MMTEQRFKTENVNGGYNNHRIDMGGNHFINGKCVNPKRSELHLCSDNVWRHQKIGDTYPETGTDVYPDVIVTGFVEIKEKEE